MEKSKYVMGVDKSLGKDYQAVSILNVKTKTVEASVIRPTLVESLYEISLQMKKKGIAIDRDTLDFHNRKMRYTDDITGETGEIDII
ncbi:hypothetical protein D1872_178410 [compost metagenome]